MTERKAKVTQEAVSVACLQLIEQKKNVTVNAVIAITGGSFSTVGAMVKEWKEEQAQQTAPVIQMPDTVTSAMQKATAEIWASASTLAGEEVEHIKNEAEEDISKAKTELSEYTGEVTRLESELKAINDKLTHSENRYAVTEKNIADLTTINTALETRLSDRDDELARLQTNYEKLQSELIEIAKMQVQTKESKNKG
ncbi:hypothetical protein MNBD_GAMMA01-1392 [hydrothermal vent metagenome]|uniref:KfrA N-terminal DNA-binding domain-containing protein n=1 Tax=hydrothermal vent metagenome TaxID=652676 RepID=A0A3B0W071_9ZZZZ